MNDEIVKDEGILYKSYRIYPQRLYPTFTGWYCFIHRENQKYMCYHTGWNRDRDNNFETEEQAVQAAKDDIDNHSDRFIINPWF